MRAAESKIAIEDDVLALQNIASQFGEGSQENHFILAVCDKIEQMRLTLMRHQHVWNPKYECNMCPECNGVQGSRSPHYPECKISQVLVPIEAT